MATANGGLPCRYCGKWSENQDHRPGCPAVTESKTAMDAWNYGYREGLREVYIPEHKFKTMHPSRVCGYLAGQDEMNDFYQWKIDQECRTDEDEF